jgi:hypothetical protein
MRQSQVPGFITDASAYERPRSNYQINVSAYEVPQKEGKLLPQQVECVTQPGRCTGF